MGNGCRSLRPMVAIIPRPTWQPGDLFVMPERYHPGVPGPYFKDKSVYDPATDSYLCPQGQRLAFRGAPQEKR